MKLSELAALCSLSTLILTVKSFSLNKPSGAIMRLTAASSLHASRNEPDFSRAASFIVGTTHPFLFSLGQNEMNPNQLNLQLGQQHATADSTRQSLRFQKFRSDVSAKVGGFARFAAPLLIQMSILVLFAAVHPALAKAAKKNLSKAPAVALKAPPLWKKILEGVNTSGAFKARKAGDTRTEFAAVLNSISSALILGGICFGAFLRHMQRENYQIGMMRKEMKKVDEYKENMYFEAVQDILTKVKDPKTKGSTKASLQKQLKDLDPEGTVQKFLEGGERPDISHIINRKSNSKGKKGGANDKSIKKKKSPPASPTASSKSSSPSSYDDDDDDDNDDDESDEIIASKNVPKKKNVPVGKEQPVREEVYVIMLGELYDGLESVLSDDSRANVVEYLKERIEAISDPLKQAATIRKIAEKLGDDDYWVDYASKLG